MKQEEEGKAVLQKRHLVTGFPLRRPGYDARVGHVGFAVDKVALERVSSYDFSFFCLFSFH
jgi:hypothetical protein